MNTDVKVSVSTESDKTTLLIGTALTPKEPIKLVINGNFQAVGKFIENKRNSADHLQRIDQKSAVVICNAEKLTISFLADPNDQFATEVNGKAEFSKELELFGINQNKFFNREQLIKLFRFNRRFFPNKEENAKILQSYQNFKASVNKEIGANSDQRGNVQSHLSKAVKTDLPENFVIAIPIFKGEEVNTFPVEICIEENDSGVRFWFESIELAELLELKKEQLFARELEFCKDLAVIFE